jgi:plastocyanin
MKTSNVKTVAILSAIALMTVLVIGCGSSSKSTNPPPPVVHSANFHNVTINNFAFSPDSLNIPAGDTVLWTNDQNVTHTVTSDTGTELGHQLTSGSNYQHIFGAAGTYRYHCSIHTTMHGVVVVH